MNKVIVRIKGGLGNQLFCYAAARRLALVNDAELVIDDVTGFARDRQYRRQYALDHFRIPARKATPVERMEPFERYRRWLLRWYSRNRPFAQRRYLEQEGVDFDKRLLDLRVNGSLYLDGLWQSEDYFADVEQTIRKDLRIIPPTDVVNKRMATEIQGSRAVAVHVRWFDTPGNASKHYLADYYQRAIALMESRFSSPRYFLFSNVPDGARGMLPVLGDKVTCVSHNEGDQNGYADLWLMSLCQHFITANSTLSWWAAWMGGAKHKIVVSPKSAIREHATPAWNVAWDFPGQIPSSWLKI